MGRIFQYTLASHLSGDKEVSGVFIKKLSLGSSDMFFEFKYHNSTCNF